MRSDGAPRGNGARSQKVCDARAEPEHAFGTAPRRRRSGTQPHATDEFLLSGVLVFSEQSMAPPANPQQPRGRSSDRCVRREAYRLSALEAVEMRRARERIQAGSAVSSVMSMILQHVKKGSPDFERGAKGSRMKPVSEDGAAAIHTRVQATGNANSEPLHRA